MLSIKAIIQFKGAAPVVLNPEHVQMFLRGEIAPAVADEYVAAGMPRRGLVSYTMRISAGGVERIIGPNLARRAGTLSSAL